jgi:hypothetical protein
VARAKRSSLALDASLRRIYVVTQVMRPQCYNAGMTRGGGIVG